MPPFYIQLKQPLAMLHFSFSIMSFILSPWSVLSPKSFLFPFMLRFLLSFFKPLSSSSWLPLSSLQVFLIPCLYKFPLHGIYFLSFRKSVYFPKYVFFIQFISQVCKRVWTRMSYNSQQSIWPFQAIFRLLFFNKICFDYFLSPSLKLQYPFLFYCIVLEAALT